MSCMAQAGSTILNFSIASSVIISELSIFTLISAYFISKNKTSFEQYCLISSDIDQNNNTNGLASLQLSAKYLTSGSSDWPN